MKNHKTKSNEISNNQEDVDEVDVVRAILHFIIRWGWLTVVLVYLFISNWFTFVCAQGESMEPTIRSGEVLACDRTYKDYTYDDIVVICTHEPYLWGMRMKIIKRVVAVPGDTVQIIDGYLYVNGICENRGLPRMEKPGILMQPMILGEGMYCVLGDNRNYSADSRDYGAFDISQFYGKITSR